MQKIYDLIVVGSGAAGMIAAIKARRGNNSVLLIEQLPSLGAKLKATGGGRCNLTNTLSNSDFMNSFGRDGKFMSEAIELFNHKDLIEFLDKIGIKTHIPDGFRVFPTTHDSKTIIDGLCKELNSLGVEILCDTKVLEVLAKESRVVGVKSEKEIFHSNSVVVATGGLGYPILGANGDGYSFAKELGHKITPLYPAMLPLYTKEQWVKECRADTIAKAEIKIDLKKAKRLKACGDLIFTSKGLRGPVILDFAREITPFLEKYDEVPLLISMVKGKNQQEIFEHFKKYPTETILDSLERVLPRSVSKELCKLCEIDFTKKFKDIEGVKRELLVKVVYQTPLTIIGHQGFKNAMITRGGVSLKEINPKTMQSKITKGLYFCGEVMDLDGPCGGYNLQWSFSSGYLAGHLFN